MVQIHWHTLLLMLRFPFSQAVDFLLHGSQLLLPIMVLGDKDARREQYEKSDRSPPRAVWVDEHVDNFVLLAGVPCTSTKMKTRMTVPPGQPKRSMTRAIRSNMERASCVPESLVALFLRRFVAKPRSP